MMTARVANVPTSRDIDQRVAAVAAAIAEPSRARMLSTLMDGRARTATELAVVAGVAPSTASAHLATLRTQRLIECVAQGKHRYFTLAGPEAAAAIEALFGVAGASSSAFAPRTPGALRYARTCYDHAAGELAVSLHDRLFALKWLTRRGAGAPRAATDGARGGVYALTPAGEAQLSRWGIDCDAVRGARRRTACACLDWSERRAHLGGALGAALLTAMLEKKWVRRELDSRALELTDRGRRGLAADFGVAVFDSSAREGAA
jgi:DNA-binding transcriptional ArsR family regulator